MKKHLHLAARFNAHWFLPALSLCLLVFKGDFLSDGDTGVHIRIGQYMLEHHVFIRQDIFSYFSPAVPWHNHEWLSQVMMAFLFSFSGLKGVVLFYYLLAAAILGILYPQIKAKSGTGTAFLIFILAFINLNIHFLARPHLFTLFFVVLWKKILDDFQDSKTNYLFCLPLLMVLWVNLHGGFVMGMLMLGIYGVGNFIPVLLKRGDVPRQLDRSRAFVITVLACFFVTLLNPDGIYIWKYILSFTSNPLLMNRISEFKSTDFHEFAPTIHFVYWVLIGFAASRIPLGLIDWLLTAVFASMALYSMRHLPLFTLVTAPLLARKLYGFFQDIKLQDFSLVKKTVVWIKNVMVFGNVLFLTMMIAVGIYVLGPFKTFAYDSKSKPVEAVEFIQSEKIPGRIFTTDEYGDYLLFKLWPETKVFIYGWFNDTGAMERFRDYLEVGLVRPRWHAVLEKHQINAVLYDTDAPLTNVLLLDPRWKLIYSDSVASLFIRNTPANQPWIDSHSGVVLSSVKSL